MFKTVLFLILSSVTSQIASGAETYKFPTGQGHIKYNGVNRSYILHIPPAVASRAKKVPLVLVLHGGGGNAKNVARMTGFSQKAYEEGFIVAYPDGSARFKKFRTWNVKHCCGYAMKKKTDDIGFISALIDKLIQQHPIDPRRIFVTGMSNGGMMSHRIGMELSGKIAGIAPVVSGLFGDEIPPPNPVPALIINGFLDKSFPLNGGQTRGKFTRSWDGTPLKTVKYQGEFWAKTNGCTTDQVKEQQDTSTLIWTYDCPENQNVIHYLVKNNGHAWPGGKKGYKRGDTPTPTVNATDIIWDFFSRLN